MDTAEVQGSADREGRGGSVAARVTAQVAEALRHGVRPWTQPWSNAAALALPLRATGQAYRGVNVLVLWAVALERGYTSPHWLSFHQARALGGSVRRGEKATHVVYYSGPQAPARDDQKTDAEHPRRRAFLRTYSVFNATQVEGLPAHFYAPSAACNEPDDARLAALFARVPAIVRHGGARACYNPQTDVIHLPPRTAFTSTALFYATLAHELGHWTGHESRLNRELSGPATPSSYAEEELVAELASAFIGAELGLPPDHVECHAAYIDHWTKALDRDPSVLMAAAGKAQAAADLLRGYLFNDPTSEPLAETS